MSSVAVSLVMLFSATIFPLLQVYNVYRFLIINSNFNLSFGSMKVAKKLQMVLRKYAANLQESTHAEV